MFSFFFLPPPEKKKKSSFFSLSHSRKTDSSPEINVITFYRQPCIQRVKINNRTPGSLFKKTNSAKLLFVVQCRCFCFRVFVLLLLLFCCFVVVVGFCCCCCGCCCCLFCFVSCFFFFFSSFLGGGGGGWG